MNVKIFSDGADYADMIEMNSKDYISGLTTNPTLMRKSGVTCYKTFAQDILNKITEKPISFEVFSDNFLEMEKQAIEISNWAKNVYVKIPITNTKKEFCYDLIKRLSNKGVKLNITALMTIEQVKNVLKNLNPEVPSYISVFAGRVADTGRDPLPLMYNSVNLIKKNPKCELIWASTRELYNIRQAEEVGCHIITVTKEIIQKLHLIDYDLEKLSLETVKMFYGDALAAGYRI